MVKGISPIVYDRFDSGLPSETYFTVCNNTLCMAKPSSGPGERKFTNKDVLAAFEERHRRSVGKIELSAKEITEILNSEILPPGTEVTRQAVDKRLKTMVGDQLVRAEHGRAYLYRRAGDLERLFQPEVATTSPAGGGGGGGSPGGDGTLQMRDSSRMGLPGALILLLFAVVGWETYKIARNSVTGGDPFLDTGEWAFDLKGLAYLIPLGVLLVVEGGLAALFLMSAYGVATGGPVDLILAYLVGFAGLVAVVTYAGGALGAPAKLLTWTHERV